jgi:allophanate hydrolase subunit 1
METYQESMQSLREVLMTAMRVQAIPMALSALVGMSELMVRTDTDKERATEILALVMHYPMNAETRAEAERLFLELEAELCPRVIVDAKAQAEEITLDEMVDIVLND